MAINKLWLIVMALVVVLSVNVMAASAPLTYNPGDGICRVSTELFTLKNMLTMQEVTAQSVGIDPKTSSCSPYVDTFVINPCIENMKLDTEMDIILFGMACIDAESNGPIFGWNVKIPDKVWVIGGVNVHLQVEPDWFGWNTPYTKKVYDECGGADGDMSCIRYGMDKICDDIYGRIILYYGDSNEQDTGWSGAYNPVDSIYWDSDNFNLNKSGTYQMKIMLTSNRVGQKFYWNDQTTCPEVDGVATCEVQNMMFTKILNFTVADEGVNASQYGECFTTDFNQFPIEYGSQGIRDAFEGFGNTWTSNILYMLFMAIIAGALLFTIGSGTGRSFGSISKESHGWLFGIIFFVEGLLAIIGVWIEALSALWLVLFGLVIIIPGAMKIYNMITGGSR